MSNCCPQPTGFAALADHPGIVVVAYFAAFFPWGVLQGLDFISPRWHKVRNIRRKGYFHLAVSIPPLGYVLFYSHVQRMSGDYKEMSAAIAAAVLTLIHILRTMWGLFQLQAFKAWCTRALMCMERMGCYMLESRIHGEVYLDTVRRQVDYLMRVNETLIDNEFWEADLPMTVTAPTFGWARGIKDLFHGKTEDWLFCMTSVSCNVRWLASFLCQFGVKWSGTCPLDNLEPFSAPAARLIQVQAFLQVTANIEGSAKPPGVEGRVLELHSFLQPLHHFLFRLVPDMKPKVFAYSVPLEKGSVFQIAKQKFNFDDALNNYDIKALDHMKLDEENETVVKSLSLTSVQTFMALLDEQREDWGEYREHVEESPLWGEMQSSSVPVSIVLAQLGLPASSELDAVLNGLPIPKTLCSALLWGQQTNRCLLQASVHIDNLHALETGRILSEGDGVVVKKEPLPHYVFYLHEKLEIERPESTDKPENRKVRHFGCILETVRSFLAQWLVSTSNSGVDVDWSPPLPTTPFVFSGSTQLFGCLHRFPSDRYAQFAISSRVIWECQAALQAAVARGEHMDALPQSAALIMLFILGFPALCTAAQEPGDHARRLSAGMEPILIEATHGPQDIRVRVDWEVDSRQVLLQLVPGEGVTEFSWDQWKNAALGRFSGQYKRVRDALEAGGGDATELVRMSDCRFSKIADPMIHVQVPHETIRHLPHSIWYWTGWPPAHLRLAHFEMNQLVAGAHNSTVKKTSATTSVDMKFAHVTFKEEIDLAVKAIDEIGGVFDQMRTADSMLRDHLYGLRNEAREKSSREKQGN